MTRARHELQFPLARLQAPQVTGRSLQGATQFVAEAMRALYVAETAFREQRAESIEHPMERAMEALSQALKLVELEARNDASLDAVSESIARTLALLFPVVRGQACERRAVTLGDLDGPDIPLALVPKATAVPPTRLDAASTLQLQHDGRTTPRAMLEVDIGLLSQSHFYTGLSQDVSRGGVFVATYQPLDRGTLVTLYFELPSGVALEAPGVVRWTRDATDTAAPGMGVAFEELDDHACSAIADYCVERPPLYHDTGED